jgi:hypothetical protein
MITREEFMKYYDVQMCGKYNMLDSRAVKSTGLSLVKYMDIIKNYDKYYNMFLK